MYIPSEFFGNQENENLIFIHGNGFTPGCYRPFINKVTDKYHVKSMLLRPLWPNEESPIYNIKNWSIFENDLEDFVVQNRNIPISAIGHSIGGNILLKVALRHPDYFKQIILLDPTIFDQTTIFLWKLVSFLGVQKIFLKEIKLAEMKKMTYTSRISMYERYRKKRVFSKISDQNLMILIDSITRIDSKDNVSLIYPNDLEALIFKTGLMNDNFIWSNINHLKVNCLMIRGQNSNVFLKKTADTLKSMSDKISLKTLIGSSHLFPLEKPNRTYDLIKKSIQ